MTSPIVLEDAPVRLDGVTVRYKVALDAHVTLKESIVRGRRRRFVEHVALDDVTLAIGRGEMLGVIGRNGAGKTTLLNVLARVLQPTSGRLRLRGSVSSIIDLFSGFHPELTGRENAYLRGAFLAVSRARMHERMDSIAAFADIGRFFDAPLRTYSAGMVVRLAFAVTASVDADILLIDEALGVGDAEFQAKCAARMAEHRARGVTFVVVSHDVARLQASCDRIVWLDQGRIRALGDPHDVVAQYAAAQHPA
jgi:lipopolysaccharide transport system ATP-binding protein